MLFIAAGALSQQQTMEARELGEQGDLIKNKISPCRKKEKETAAISSFYLGLGSAPHAQLKPLCLFK